MQTSVYDKLIEQYLKQKDDYKNDAPPTTAPLLMRSLNYREWEDAQKQFSKQLSNITTLLVKEERISNTQYILYRINGKYWCITIVRNYAVKIEPFDK